MFTIYETRMKLPARGRLMVMYELSGPVRGSRSSACRGILSGRREIRHPDTAGGGKRRRLVSRPDGVAIAALAVMAALAAMVILKPAVL